MTVKIYQVDAFTPEPFKGNPAAVCLLAGAASADWMQRVAMEQNLSETSFVTPGDGVFELRWFTPEVEVPLCGHATLASAHVLWETGLLDRSEVARFQTRSGELQARWSDGRIELDLPAYLVEEAELPPGVAAALDVEPLHVARTPERCADFDVLIELESAGDVRRLQPDFAALRDASTACWIVTARGDGGHDVVSRYFAPVVGIDEDPVTGAAHCSLVPYWSRKLDRRDLVCYQASARGGVVYGRYDGGDRVQLAGEGVTVMRGELVV